MKIIETTPDEAIDRMYCPSTDEVIFAPGYEEINEDAKAFIACWNGSYMDEPIIKDKSLSAAWNVFYKEVFNVDRYSENNWDEFRNFLTRYNNPKWVVYECDFYGMACGPTYDTLVFVVKADTVIEDDPDYDPDAEEEPMQEMSDEELTNEIISKQMKAILKHVEKNKE
jgi:hypothetical protein